MRVPFLWSRLVLLLPLVVRAAGRVRLANGAQQSSVAEAIVEMVSADPAFRAAAKADPSSFALSVAEHLSQVANVPLARFAVILKVPSDLEAAASAEKDKILACQPTVKVVAIGGAGQPPASSVVSAADAGAQAVRFASSANTTFVCQPFPGRELNTSIAAPTAPPGPMTAEQREEQSHILSATPILEGKFLQQRQKKRAAPVEWEMAIQAATGLARDWTSSVEVAAAIVKIAKGLAEPKAELLPDGNWSYGTTRADVLFMRFFPDTRASLPAVALPPRRETALTLGANPGGRNEEREESTTPIPTTTTLDAAALAAFDAARRALGRDPNEKNGPGDGNATVMAAELLKQANKINFEVRATVEEMTNGLARGSQAHLEYLTKNPYSPERVWPSGPLLPSWP